MNDIIPFVLLGLAAGVLSGLLGIGGAIVIIPALVYLFGFPQHRAEGTTLALMVPPIGILAVIPFFKRGCVDVRAAALICAWISDRRIDRRTARREILRRRVAETVRRAAPRRSPPACCSGAMISLRTCARISRYTLIVDLAAAPAACCESGTP